VVHAQPVYLTYLSHIPRYQSASFMSRHLLRWRPEAVVNLPEGLGCVRFHVPGSAGLCAATFKALRSHRIAVWSKHGVVARSDQSVKRAVDRIEYAETAAHYEFLNLTNGGAAKGLSDKEIRDICRAFGINNSVFGRR